jgi:protease I
MWAFVAAVLVLGLGCQQAESQKANLTGKKIVMIIAHQKFRDEELQVPKAALEECGAKVTVASSSTDDAKGMLGATVKPDVLLQDVKPADYDAVIFVGGVGAAGYFDDPVAHKIAQDAAAQGKLVCAICYGPSILANAGVLKGKKSTCYSNQSANLEKNGAEYTGKAVERDGKIITANGPKAAKEFANAIIAALAEKL